LSANAETARAALERSAVPVLRLNPQA